MERNKKVTQRTYLENVDNAARYQPTSEEIITQPNQSFSLREILERFTRGGELTGIPPVFEIPEVFEALGVGDLERMTKVEKAQLGLDLENLIEAEKEKIVASKNVAYKKALDKFVKQEVKKVLDGKEKETDPTDKGE